jgi:uncharacterized cupredoxin-like copper-binding protein
MLSAAGMSLLALVSGCGVAAHGGDGQMMGGGSGYHYSSLTCTPPSSPPEHTIAVNLGDMGMTRMMGGTAPRGGHMLLTAAPTEVRAGSINLMASNRGWRTHELVILPLATGEQAGRLSVARDGRVAETASVGEASKSCAGGVGEGIKAGTVGWTRVTLAAGRYELVCNLPNHYANGMYQELDVT